MSVPLTATAAEAFELITKHELNGVAVVDDNGVLYGNLSVSDLKVIGTKHASKSYIQLRFRANIHCRIQL